LAVGSWQLAVGSWQLAVGSWQLAVGSWQLAVGQEMTAYGSGPDFHIEVAIPKDGRTMTMSQDGAAMTVTVVDDGSGDVLFEMTADASTEDPPEGIEVTETGGFSVVDTDGTTVFEVAEDEVSRAWEEAYRETGAFSEFDDEAYVEPETILGYTSGDGEWVLAPLSDVAGVDGRAYFGIGWGDGFLVVVDRSGFAAVDAVEAPDTTLGDSGEPTVETGPSLSLVTEEDFDGQYQPPKLLLLTPAG
jgi:hypothetical protein